MKREEAEEFTRNLGEVASGSYGLMDMAMHTLGVPKALGMTIDEWVLHIGGYVRRPIEDRREAVKELTEAGRSTAQVAQVLGIGEATVKNDRAVIRAEGTARSPEEERKPAGEPDQEGNRDRAVPLPPDQRRARVAELEAAGKTTAEMAVELGVSISTIQKDQRDLKKAQAAEVEKALEPVVAEANESQKVELDERLQVNSAEATARLGVRMADVRNALRWAIEEYQEVVALSGDDEMKKAWRERWVNLQAEIDEAIQKVLHGSLEEAFHTFLGESAEVADD